METNNIDKVVKDLLKSRTIAPSDSAWERLTVQLDEIPKKRKRKRFLYLGYAASLLLIIAVTFFKNHDSANVVLFKEIASQITIDSIKTAKSITTDKLVPLEKVFVKENSSVNLKNIKKEVKENIINNNEIVNKSTENIELSIAITNTDSENLIRPIIERNINSRIRINSNDLLASVVDNKTEIEQFYSQNKINRNELLKSIQKELDQENININANTLLAEVEKDIDEETFKESFIQLIKEEFKSLTSSLANRNN